MDYDLFVGTRRGFLYIFENIGDPFTPVFALHSLNAFQARVTVLVQSLRSKTSVHMHVQVGQLFVVSFVVADFTDDGWEDILTIHTGGTKVAHVGVVGSYTDLRLNGVIQLRRSHGPAR